jgi:predicted peptidase
MRRQFLVLILSVSIFFSLNAQTKTPDLAASIHPSYHEYLPHNYSNTTDKCPCLIFLHENGEIRHSWEPDIWEIADHCPFKKIHVNKHDMCFRVNEQEYFNVIGTQTGISIGISAADFQKIYNHNYPSYMIDSGRFYITGLGIGGERGYEWAVRIVKSPTEITVLGKMSGTIDSIIVKMVGSGKITIWSHHGEREFKTETKLIL